MPDDKTRCPICNAEMGFNPRYPRAVCQSCARRATSSDGRPLSFGNVSLSGGFEAHYADTGEPYPGDHECYIDGVRCCADEAHFGGIVVEVAD